MLVHLLIAQAFIPNPDNLPIADHIDRVKTNNNDKILRWATYEQSCLNIKMPIKEYLPYQLEFKDLKTEKYFEFRLRILKQIKMKILEHVIHANKQEEQETNV